MRSGIPVAALLVLTDCATRQLTPLQVEGDVASRMADVACLDSSHHYRLRRRQTQSGRLYSVEYTLRCLNSTTEHTVDMRLMCNESGGPIDAIDVIARPPGPQCRVSSLPYFDRGRPSFVAPALVATLGRFHEDFTCSPDDMEFEFEKPIGRVDSDVIVRGCGQTMTYRVECTTFDSRNAADGCRFTRISRGPASETELDRERVTALRQHGVEYHSCGDGLGIALLEPSGARMSDHDLSSRAEELSATYLRVDQVRRVEYGLCCGATSHSAPERCLRVGLGRRPPSTGQGPLDRPRLNVDRALAEIAEVAFGPDGERPAITVDIATDVTPLGSRHSPGG